ncbi:signal peptidase II [Holdemania massiliensis]|uniref:signal peptidase II n=1 Tax=Holdemania massiliensis TaxID=1468449 RepID=UPI001F063BA3|nr:signal peptidase II [Holdemania massiliensis]MCH1941894.1 hypothetical protein [Holdemania massiliensis]
MFDQIIKLVIANRFMDCEFTLIDGWLRFYPIQNTQLSYGGQFLSLLSNPLLLIVINLIILFLYWGGYRFYKIKRKKNHHCCQNHHDLWFGWMLLQLN